MVFSCLLSLYSAGPEVGNYVGDGENPNISLTLSTNSPGWQPYSVAHSGQANIPYDTNNPKNNTWSSWNLVDEKGNYYGTLTLGANAYATWWQGYSAPQDKDPTSAYYIDGISGKVSGQGYFISIAGTPKQDGGQGPFSKTPKAIPAIDSETSKPIVLSVKGGANYQ